MQVLAAFLKCIGHIIPLMDAVYANYYTREVMFILVREFQTPDEEMKKIVLKVVKQCVGTEGVEPEYIRTDILGPFFANFWVRRMALDRRNYRALVETTVELANKVSLLMLLMLALSGLLHVCDSRRCMAGSRCCSMTCTHAWLWTWGLDICCKCTQPLAKCSQ